MEQAFRVLSGIYSQAFPTRANELLQYVETISSAAETVPWESVYQFDQTFRQLMTAYPKRSWSVLYLQGWGIMLRSQGAPRNGYSNEAGTSGSSGNNKAKRGR